MNKGSLVHRLWLAQGGQCFHCYEPMLNVRQSQQRWSREHLYPKSTHGHVANGIVLAHRSCNEARGDRYPTPDELERARELYFVILGIPVFPAPDHQLPPFDPARFFWPAMTVRVQ